MAPSLGARKSAGFSFSKGLPDSLAALSADADFQAGYTADLDEMARNAARCGHRSLDIDESGTDVVPTGRAGCVL